MTGTHMIVLPGGGYAEHASHEAEPVVEWLGDIGVRASVFRYPLRARHPEPLNALRAEIRRRRAAGAQRIGLIGYSAGGHLAGLAALAPGAPPDEAVDFAVLGYAITSMETETYRPARHTYRLAAALAAGQVPTPCTCSPTARTASASPGTPARPRYGPRWRKPGSTNRRDRRLHHWSPAIACSSAICLRAAATSSSLVFA